MIKKFEDRIEEVDDVSETIITKIESILNRTSIVSGSLPLRITVYVSYPEYNKINTKVLSYIREQYAKHGWSIKIAKDWTDDYRDSSYYLNVTLNKRK